MKYEDAEVALDKAAKDIFTHGWSAERQEAYDAAFVALRSAAEAVLSGTACHSVEQHRHETTSNDAQSD